MKSKFLVILGVCMLMLSGCQGYKYQADNIVEEVGEEAVRYYTGAEIDVTPGTPEKGFTPGSVMPIVKDR